MDNYEKEKSPYHGMWVNCLLMIGVPVVVFLVFYPMFRQYQKGYPELNLLSARIVAGGVGLLFHLSLAVAGVFRESFATVTGRVSEFFEDLGIGFAFAIKYYWENVKSDGVVFLIYLVIMVGSALCFGDALRQFLAQL